MAAILLTAAAVKEELCALDSEARTERALDLFANPSTPGDVRALAGHYAAYGLIHADDPGRALAIVVEALPFSEGYRRACLLEVQALALMNLGRIPELGWVLDLIDQLEGVPESVQAHSFVLRGASMLLNQDVAGFDWCVRGADLFHGQPSSAYQEAWAWETAATYALRVGDYDRAATYLDRIDHPDFLTASQLLRADLAYLTGELEQCRLLIDTVGDPTQLTPLNRGRHCYLRAALASVEGNLYQASDLLDQAREVLNNCEDPALSLRRAISTLRGELRQRGE